MTRATVSAVALVLSLLLGVGVGALWSPRSESPATTVLTSTEIGFAQDMAAHHEQAIVLCDAVTTNVDPAVTALCAQIRTTQLNEIGVLRGWLQLLDQPQAAAVPMAWMGAGHQHGPGALMPGMATWAEVDELRRLSDPRTAEVRLLELMIRHHRGGIDMANYAALHASSMSVIQVAGQMANEQSGELSAMSVLLARRDGQALPYP
ncbi:DUF305 domain-containing protein [Nocardia rhizosphaerihabitans]|uniref:DUF305 domain-containing protein n=1 Tax=Nocardia rhizosphaerihabitans TaxID=1691570 RepID=A0ABQ2KIB1_9NOCA|nr:DUF305 domain-containing protein [Nocardia rhizosphaerihabitans]GGN82850.1 DUF305 domain-containing protein [Nocardia rhizosphaerihabitans]